MNKPKNKNENKSEKALAAEKEQFGKQQLHSLSKTVVSSETPPKEKYVRNIILGSHKEGGARTFWSYSLNLPLSSQSLVSWKFCYLLHKVLRDGHANAVRDSNRYCRNIKDMGVLWGNLHDRYGHIVALYAKFLCLKMDFHYKHKTIPANLETSDETLDRESGTEMNKVMDMTNELLDYLDSGLKMAETVLRQLDANNAKSSTSVGQCRLTPLIPLILDSSLLYHFSVRLMFKLHSRLSPDVLLGHRERFRDLFMSLVQFFNRAKEEEFFKSFIQIPDLPDDPPNFLRAASLAEYKKPVVLIPGEKPEEDQMETQYYLMSQMAAADSSLEQKDENEILKRELGVLKPELQLIKSEAQRCVTELKAQVRHLEAEVEEQKIHQQVTLVEKEHLKMEVEALRSTNVANVGAQIGFKEADGRAQAAEVRFSQLKERHAELVTSHADLMKKNAETLKILSSTKYEQDELQRSKKHLENELGSLHLEKMTWLKEQQQEVERLNQALREQRENMNMLQNTLQSKEREGCEVSSSLTALQTERDALLRSLRDKETELMSEKNQQQKNYNMERDQLNQEIEALRAQLQLQISINVDQKAELDRLKRELDSTRSELMRLKNALHSKEMSGSQLTSTMASLQAEREMMMQSSRQQEAELVSLRQQVQHHVTSLDEQRQRSGVELANLHATLQQQQVSRLQDEQFSLLQCAVVEAEGIILDAVSKLDDPVHVRCTSSPDYLVNRSEITLRSIDKMQKNHKVYVENRNDASGLLRAVTQFSHLAADTIVTGAATSHTAPIDQSDRLSDGCRNCSNQCLQYLKDLKLQSSLQRADSAPIRLTVQRLLALAQELRPKGQDVLKEELGAMVDKEMIATSTAIEEAVLRMDEILNQAKKDTTGIKLEVNQSILGSCSDLMKAVHMLVMSATDLQKDIVEGGRGAASVPEFYAKNSRWTEGLISASKAVGWGATQLLDSADRVVTDKGTYEELIASSHEIAASTAQLVAASKVKSDRNNKKLCALQQASRHVNDMAAVVVTSSKQGQRQISDQGMMDFSGMSLIKLKKEEMEAQVKVLQLENQLEQERVRLGELRKRHYDLGSSGVNEDDGADCFPPPPPPTLLDSASTFPAFSSVQPYANTNPNPTATANTTTFPSSNPFIASQGNSVSQDYSPSAAQNYTPNQSYATSQPYTPTPNTTQLYTPTPNTTQPYTPTPNTTQPYTPTPSTTQLYTPTPNTTQLYTPTPNTTQLYTPTPNTTQLYTPTPNTTQLYTPTPNTTQLYTPTPSTTQPYAPSQSYAHIQPSVPTQSSSSFPPPSASSSLNQSKAAAQTQGSTHSPKPGRKKPNIFLKSGNLLKNAFKRSEASSGES